MSIKTVAPATSIRNEWLRPNNATQYAAGDVIGNTTNVLQETIAVGRGEGGSGRIISCWLAVTGNGVGVLAGDFELWLFDQAVASHEVDADPFTPTDADLLNLVGVLQFKTADPFEGNVTAGATGNVIYMAAQTFLPLGFQCIALSQNLHATLVVRNTYTPSAFEEYYSKMSVEQD